MLRPLALQRFADEDTFHRVTDARQASLWDFYRFRRLQKPGGNAPEFRVAWVHNPHPFPAGKAPADLLLRWSGQVIIIAFSRARGGNRCLFWLRLPFWLIHGVFLRSTSDSPLSFIISI